MNTVELKKSFAGGQYDELLMDIYLDCFHCLAKVTIQLWLKESTYLHTKYITNFNMILALKVSNVGTGPK